MAPKTAFFVISLLFMAKAMAGQDTIRLYNPSFEDTPQAGKPPKGWISEDSEYGPGADTQPGFFDVIQPAAHGNTFVGLVTRVSSTCEYIGQTLSRPLQKEKLYQFSLYAYRDRNLVSLVRGHEYYLYPFKKPVLLRIWGGEKPGDSGELLAEVEVKNTSWAKYNFEIMPQKQNWPAVTFEAFFVPGTRVAYNGNVMIDGCSPFIEMEKH